MSYLDINLLALALAIDCFTVGASLGSQHNSFRQVFRLTFHFGLFQGLLLLVGILIGSTILLVFDAWDHWIALVILMFLGGKMIYGAYNNSEDEKEPVDLTRGLYLIGFSTAVSIDALAAGVGVASAKVPVYYSAFIVGFASSILTYIGIRIARRFTERLGSYSEVIAGLVLNGLGFKILLEHYFA